MTENEDVTQHPAMLQNIAIAHAHSIRVVESLHPIDRYTCLMHVFDFAERPEYIAIADYGLGRVYAGADFAHWLIENGRLEEIPSDKAQACDLVMYFREGIFRHVGLVQLEGRVLSKWGTGHFYDHATLEVPESYGNEVRYYNAVSYESAFHIFTEFAEENGILFEDSDDDVNG